MLKVRRFRTSRERAQPVVLFFSLFWGIRREPLSFVEIHRHYCRFGNRGDLHDAKLLWGVARCANFQSESDSQG